MLLLPHVLLLAAGRRRLSWLSIAGYAPGSNVVDHNAVDLDQAAIEDALGATTVDYARAKQIYEEGGNSKAYAELELDDELDDDIAAGTEVEGETAGGDTVIGSVYAAASAGDETLRVKYPVGETAMSECRVGGLDASHQVTTGCLENSGSVSVEGHGSIGYSGVTNKAGRTLQGFSTAAEAKMYDGCPGCPYHTYKMFYDYYKDFNYADSWVLAALNDEDTAFTSKGNAKFADEPDVMRVEGIKKGTAYMNVWMYVIREFEDAIDDCEAGCIDCNDDPVHAWDEGVAFYTGSLEGTDGAGSGKMPYALADKRCENYKTCGEDGDSISGTSKVNIGLGTDFALGQHYLQTGQCAQVPQVVRDITAKMTVPLVQGTMRYAYKMEYLSGGDKELAEGATFAAAVLPQLNYCSQTDAETVYDNLKITGTWEQRNVDFGAVRAAFEANYECLNITCADVGGLWNSATDSYYDYFAPCDAVIETPSNDCVSPPPPSNCENKKSNKKCNEGAETNKCTKGKFAKKCAKSCTSAGISGLC